MPFYTEGKRGTIVPNPNFNGEEACVKLSNSMEGIGTDERSMTDVVLGHSNQQRQDIKKLYPSIYDRELMPQIESELTYSYEKIVLALMMDPQEFILDCINEAVTLSKTEGVIKKIQKSTYKKGIAADEHTLMGLLILRTNSELEELKSAYKKKYKRNLEKMIANSKNLSTDFRRLIIAMIDGKRDETPTVNGELIFKDVMKLMGGTKQELFHIAMHERSYQYLIQLIDGYKDFTGKGIENIVESSNFSLDLKETYLALLTLIRNPPEYFAKRLHDAIEGLGTDDDTLIQIMVLRSEVDLIDIIRCYDDKYNTPLCKDIAGDTNGDYQDILVKMCIIPEAILIAEAKEKKKLVRGEAQNEEDPPADG